MGADGASSRHERPTAGVGRRDLAEFIISAAVVYLVVR